MFIQLNPQQNSGQPPEKSTTMWTRPTSDEEKKYYSKHAPERRVYGIIMTLFQTGHGVLAFAAWASLYAWGLEKFPMFLFLVPVLAFLTLISLHVLFRTTWETFWYDKLDSDPNTDSPLAVPALIMVMLLGCEIYGAQRFLEGKVEVAKMIETEPVTASQYQEIARLRREFSMDSARIERVYAQKEASVSIPFDAAIKRLQKQRSTAQGNNRKWINHLIAVEEEKKTKAIAPVMQDKAAALEKSAMTLSTALEKAGQRHEKVLAGHIEHNEREQGRERMEKANASTYSWGISILLLAIIAALGWRRVKINVRSGIIPLHQYTVLDAHGSAAERVYTALSDAANRRWLQFAVWLHARLSPKKPLVSFDGTVVTRPGNYNTPEAMQSGAPAPHPTKTEEQARQEVAEKATKAGVTLTAPQFRAEVEKSLASNGHYRDMPLGKTEPEASAPAPTGDSDQARLRTVLTRANGLDMEMRRHNGNDETAYTAAYNELYGDSELAREGGEIGINWGRGQDQKFLAGVSQSGQYYPVVDLLALPYISFPPMQQQEDGFLLFKQTGELFKQIRNSSGAVIGLEYKGPRMSETTTLSYSQVQSRISSYRNNAGRNDETRKKMLAVWQGALALFERDNQTQGQIRSAVEEEVGP